MLLAASQTDTTIWICFVCCCYVFFRSFSSVKCAHINVNWLSLHFKMLVSCVFIYNVIHFYEGDTNRNKKKQKRNIFRRIRALLCARDTHSFMVALLKNVRISNVDAKWKCRIITEKNVMCFEKPVQIERDDLRNLFEFQHKQHKILTICHRTM